MYKNLLNAYQEFWLKATNFKSKTTRSDWWRVQLVNIIISIFTIPISLRTFGFNIYGLVCIIPQIAIDVRRLRDFGKNWKWLFINLIPRVLLTSSERLYSAFPFSWFSSTSARLLFSK